MLTIAERLQENPNQEKTYSSEDCKIISSVVPIISSYDDEDINAVLGKCFSSRLPTSKGDIPSDCDSLYNFISEILTLGYNVCYSDSVVLDVFDSNLEEEF